MRKLICLSATLFFIFASFVIPYMFLMFTEPTGANLTGMCLFFAMSVLGAYGYGDTYMSIRKKNN